MYVFVLSSKSCTPVNETRHGRFHHQAHATARSVEFNRDMRFHVLGLGPVGQLFAFHFRRSLSPKHSITLMFKTSPLAKNMLGRPILVERDSVLSKVSGFDTEASHQLYHDLEDKYSEAERAQFELETVAGTGHRNELLLPSSIPPSAITEFDNERAKSHIDSLIVCCKAQSTHSAIKRLERRLSRESTVVLFQNGNLSVYDQLVKTLFKDEETRPNFILVSNTHGAWLKRPPFHIVHAGIGKIRFGIVPNGTRDFEKSYYAETGKRTLNLDDIAETDRDPEVARYRSLRNTVAVLQGLSDLYATWEPFSNIQVHLRQKLVVNCVVNPITAIIGCRNGYLYDNHSATRIARQICNEAETVFRKELIANSDSSQEQIDLPKELLAKNLLNEVRQVIRATGPNMSSMLVDLKKGNMITEIDFLNGHLQELAVRYNVDAPVNAALYDLMKLRMSIPIDTIA